MWVNNMRLKDKVELSRPSTTQGLSITTWRVVCPRQLDASSPESHSMCHGKNEETYSLSLSYCECTGSWACTNCCWSSSMMRVTLDEREELDSGVARGRRAVPT